MNELFEDLTTIYRMCRKGGVALLVIGFVVGVILL